jgi:hypothetical protein
LSPSALADTKGSVGRRSAGWERRLPNIAYDSGRLTYEHMAAGNRATVLMGRDAAWEAWLESAGLNEPGAFAYLAVDDRGRPYRMVRGNDLTYKVGVDRILTAEAEGRLVAEWLSIFGEMYDYWSEKKRTAPPPPLPDANATLPPEVEANLMSARMEQVAAAAELDALDDVLDETD